MHQIGVGVLGSVFRASHPEGGRSLTVKTFELDGAPEQIDRFAGALEHLVSAGLSHPSIVTPLDTGIQLGVPYLVSDYAPGESLDAILRRDATANAARALTLVRGLAAAVDAAHGRGVVHGGLHLRDVLVAGDDVRLTGFGVASALEHAGIRPPVRRPYAAPELIAGRRWGPEADRFSVAAIAYELLTGTRPAGTGEELLVRLRDLDGAAIEDRAGLQQAFRNALAAEPEIRPAAAAGFVTAFGNALGAAAAGELLSAPTDAPAAVAIGESAPAGAAVGESAAPRGVASSSAARGAGSATTRGAVPGGESDAPPADAAPAPPSRAKPIRPSQVDPKPARERLRPAEPRLPLSAGDEPAAEIRPSDDPGPIAARLAGMAISDPAAANESAPADAAARDRRGAAPGIGEGTAGKGTAGEGPAGGRPGAREDAPPARAGLPFNVPAPGWSWLRAAVPVTLAITLGVVGAILLNRQLGTSDDADGGAGSAPVPLAETAAGRAGIPPSESGGAEAGAAATPETGNALPSVAAGERGAVAATEQVLPTGASAAGEAAPVAQASPAPAGESVAPASSAPSFDAAGGEDEAVSTTAGAAAALSAPVDADPVLSTPVDADPALSAPGGAAAAATEGVAGAGIVLVRVSPPGAVVVLDGEDRGISPLSIPNVPYGSYRVTVSAPGYEPQDLQVTVSAADPIAAVGVVLVPAGEQGGAR